MPGPPKTHTKWLDKDGYVTAPDRPELGIEPNYELLARYRVNCAI
jgi:L-alanine-DL-glutamate epimerase-like enolase superfamily enzyme